MKYEYTVTKQLFKSIAQASKELNISKAKLSSMLKDDGGDFVVYDDYKYTKEQLFVMPKNVNSILIFPIKG